MHGIGCVVWVTWHRPVSCVWYGVWYRTCNIDYWSVQGVYAACGIQCVGWMCGVWCVVWFVFGWPVYPELVRPVQAEAEGADSGRSHFLCILATSGWDGAPLEVSWQANIL